MKIVESDLQTHHSNMQLIFPFCLVAVSAQMVHVGTMCLKETICLDDHASDVALFIMQHPGKYEHVQTFVDYGFISTSYYKFNDSNEERPKEIVLLPFS